MTDVVFAPDSGAGFLAVFGAAVSALGLLGAFAVIRRGEQTNPSIWLGVAFFVAGGAALAFMAYREARGLSAHDGRVELHYTWPRSTRVIDARDIKDVRVQLRGTKTPSPRLVIETRDGDIYEGEGSSRRELINTALSLVRDQMSRITPTGQ
jgi:hypothetical protein